MAVSTQRRNIVGFYVILVLHVHLVPVSYAPPFFVPLTFSGDYSADLPTIPVKIVCTSVSLELFCKRFDLVKKEW